MVFFNPKGHGFESHKRKYGFFLLFISLNIVETCISKENEKKIVYKNGSFQVIRKRKNILEKSVVVMR